MCYRDEFRYKRIKKNTPIKNCFSILMRKTFYFLFVFKILNYSSYFSQYRSVQTHRTTLAKMSADLRRLRCQFESIWMR